MNKDFINANRNDFFALLRGIDLQDLLVCVSNYLLKYKAGLNLPHDVTIGCELEFENLSPKTKKQIIMFINCELVGWKVKRDLSLKRGAEINSPIMKDEKKYWQELKKVCDYLTLNKVDTTRNAAGHIHIGNILGDDVEAWKMFLKLYLAYESIMFRFFYGDKISARKKIIEYAKPTSNYLNKNIRYIDEAKDILDIEKCIDLGNRYYSLNFSNLCIGDEQFNFEIDTIELRCPNATTNAIIWQNNINTFAKMLVSSKDKVMDEDFLNYKVKCEAKSFYKNSYLYNEIDLMGALEFVDLVFDNNLDKVYFLRQYFKNFEDNFCIKNTVKAKKFWR